MSEFKLPLDELMEKFTKSEMAIMSWSSREQSSSLEKKKPKKQKKKRQLDNLREEETETSEYRTRDLPDKFYNKEGEVDLRQVTGKEAWKFFASQGLKFAPMMKR